MNHPTALDYWTLTIAVLGAVTGVAALVTQVWEVLLSGPRVKVGMSNALHTGEGTWWLSVDASNVGRLPVTLVDVGITFRPVGGKWLNVPIAAVPTASKRGDSTPYRLLDAEAETWLLDPAAMAAAAAEHGVTVVGGYVRLATGKTVRSRNKIDVANLATFD